MPTYRFRCNQCGGATEQWLSIHHDKSEEPTRHADCGGTLTLSIEKVVTYGVGERGKHTVISDRTDRQWHKDMDAYERFHKAGIQPHQITGADKWEATAISRTHIESNGALPYSDERVAAGQEEAKQIMREVVS